MRPRHAKYNLTGRGLETHGLHLVKTEEANISSLFPFERWKCKHMQHCVAEGQIVC